LLVLSVDRSAASATFAPRQDQAIRVGVPLVNIYASVLDKHNAFVPNLDQSDFRILEDKVEQQIAFFSREKTLPLSIGLLIDTSSSEENKIGAEQQAASQFLHSVLREGDKAFVVVFDVDAKMLSNWTSDVDSLDRAIHRANVGAGGTDKLKPGVFYPNLGGTHLYDTIYAAAVNRHRGSGCPLSPATPPDMRVRIRRFRGLRIASGQARESKRIEVGDG
jgi:VWFA-related protein